MNDIIRDAPLWVDILVAGMVMLGAALALLGNIGLVRLQSFYDRVHAPTLGATLGAGFILIAAIIYFITNQGKPVLQPVLIAVFMTITTPVTLIMLTRAAIYRDRTEGKTDVPKDA